MVGQGDNDMTALRVAVASLGLAGISYALYGFVTDHGINPIGQLIFLGLALATHDFLIVPTAIGLGALVTRFAPPWARSPARTALVITGAVSIFAFPFILGKGRIFDNPSAFPQHYAADLAVIIGVVWVVAAAVALLRRRRR
jgi:hypothetical protein